MRMTASDVAAHQARIKGSRPGSQPQPSGTLATSQPRNKYRAVRTQVAGIWFDSKREAAHYDGYRLQEIAGAISQLRVHTRWPLVVNGVDCGAYESDFDFIQDGRMVIVDVKGEATEAYRLKKKIWEAIYKPLSITELRQPKRYKAG